MRSPDTMYKASVSFDISSPVSMNEIIKLLLTRFGKTCSLDPLLSFTAKKHAGPILPFIVTLFNKSLADEAFKPSRTPQSNLYSRRLA